MKIRNVIVCLFLVLLLTGCWGRRELNEIAVVAGMGVDKVGDQYLVTVQVFNPGEIATTKGGSGKAPVSTYQVKAETIFTAVRRLTTMTPRKLYFAHLRIFIIGESVARDNIAPILDLASRDHEFRSDFYVVVTKKIEANKVLKIFTPLEKVPANYLFSMLQHSEKTWAPLTTVKVDQLVSDIESKGKEAIITAVSLKGKAEEGEKKDITESIGDKTELFYPNIGVFKGNRLVGWLDEKESAGYNYVHDNVYGTVVEVPCGKDRKNVIEIMHTKTEVKASMQGQKPKVDVIVHSQGNIGEMQCQANLLAPKTMQTLGKEASQSIKTDIRKVVQIAQKKYHSDIFGFGEVVHRSEPKVWKKLETNWDDTFSTMPVDIHVQVKLKYFGRENHTTPTMK